MMSPLSRRSLLAALAAVPALPVIVPFASLAQERYLDVRPGGSFRPVRVGVAPFVGDPASAQLFTSVIGSNFKRSVFIQPIDPATFPEQILAPDQPPKLDAWRTVNAQYVLTGRAVRSSDGRLRTEFRLWDVATGEQAAGQQYVTDSNVARRVAHIVSDQVFARVTGEKGFFDSRVVFVDETGPKESRRKRLAMMDQDGANISYLTRGDDLVVTPRFSPSSQDVTYMSFGGADPKVMLMSIDSRQREVVGNFPGMTFAPRFSPDGQRIIMSLSQGTSSTLYAMDLRTRSTMRLTDSSAIDTSPSYSPDGGQIVFESDRGGSQQIYVMDARGGGVKRISFGEGGRYSTPVWSPKGDYIAFTKQSKGQFGIGVMKPDGSGERILTEGFHNEGPTFAPNGLFVMFFRESSGNSRIAMIDIFGRQESAVPTPSSASDPAWGPLLG